MNNELIETESPEMTESLLDAEAHEIEGEIETSAEHPDSHVIDEEWLDEDGLNTLKLTRTRTDRQFQSNSHLKTARGILCILAPTP